MIRVVGLIAIVAFMCSFSPVKAAEYLLMSDMGTSARAIGIGNIEGFDYSANAVFENPASLTKVPDFSVSLFHTTLINELVVHSASISQRTRFGTFGLGYFRAGVNDLTRTEITTTNEFKITGSFDYADSIAKLSYQRDLFSFLSLGMSVSKYDKKIDTFKASGYDYDLGFYSSLGRLDTSFVARNILATSVEYSNGSSENLPRQFVFSAGFKTFYGRLFSQLKMNGERGLLASFGADASLPWMSFLTFSAGYKEFFVVTEKNSSYTVGLGLKLGKVKFNYAFEKSDYVDFNFKNYFSLSVGLDFFTKKKVKNRRVRSRKRLRLSR